MSTTRARTPPDGAMISRRTAPDAAADGGVLHVSGSASRRAWLAAAVAAATLLGACSSDKATTGGPSVTFAPVPATTAAADTTVSSSSAPTTAAAPTLITTAPATAPAATDPAASDPAATDPRVAITKFADVDKALGAAVRPGDSSLYVLDQDGLIVPVAPNGTFGAPVLDVTDLTSASGERGLLGLAFHPIQPLAYIDYTDNDGNTNIAEYHVAADGTFDPASRRLVLEIDQPYPNHNGGQLAFGPDGFLYIGMGDGGSTGDPQRRALNVGVLLGKILRIDPVAAGDRPYTVPADNPFTGVAGARPEIWSVGLRNPWRFSFDTATGDLWIADVGQDAWEEVDAAWADQGAGRGTNFGWSAFEGTHPYNADQPAAGAAPPIFEYPHGDAGCSISGGARYRGAAIPTLAGWYVYADYCSGQVRALQIVDRAVAREVTLGTPGSVAAVAAGANGELFVMSVDNGVFAITPG
jgi:glucose/arabinose dehydrogenase